MVFLKYIRAQKDRFDDCILIYSIVCQIRDSVQIRGTLKGTERAVEFKKKAPVYANVWHFSSDQRLEAFAVQSLDEVTTLYM